jgi:branched-subunit amino acid ABC-type transport system permease component
MSAAICGIEMKKVPDIAFLIRATLAALGQQPTSIDAVTT